jgi:dTMP kinase
MLKKGILISVEGIDGSGKSTLAKNLVSLLEAQGFSVLLTKEPGGTHLGLQLRKLLQEKTIAIDPVAEFLLFAADRAQHFHEIVLPALQKNMIVVSDRMADSSLAYQGYGRGLDHHAITFVNNWAMQQRMPDLTIFCDISIPAATQRLKKRNETLTSFEKEEVAFRERVIHGFKEIIKTRKNVIQLDSTDTISNLAQKSYDRVIQWIQTNQLL